MADVAHFVSSRVLELVYTAHDMAPFARDLGHHGPPFPWDTERRFAIRAELDALSFCLYGVDRDDVGYIMDTFPITRAKDLAKHGHYRTKHAILAAYDSMIAKTFIPHRVVNPSRS
jgi:hypothetical protein